MGDLWVGNLEESTTDEEIREFLCRYGFPLSDSIKRVTGTGDRPAAVVRFNSVEPHVVRTFQPRIHNIFWKNHKLVVQVMPERNED
ncbi:RNA-binding protein [Caballeronia sp. ATUFL_M1_KS5A]|uniref:RNA recognition motif domain-containing protein n=1 Tax=Caballeronia sp. ATUFL_M1_KS5A TaxID=2921778 RepID=UPI002027A4D4|nr:RNA-binding protein [Caballeronia sp. ATUFL_M1_KS5A]